MTHNGIGSAGGIGLTRFKAGEKLGHMPSQEVGHQAVRLVHGVPADGPHREVVVTCAGQGPSQDGWEHSDVGKAWAVVKRLVFQLYHCHLLATC